MKGLTKETLAQKGQKYLKRYGVEYMYATPDGQFFLNAGRAKLHAQDDKIYKIGLLDKNSLSEKGKRLTVKEIQELIKEETSLDVLKGMLLKETEGGNRIGAIEAIEERVKAILEEEDENGDGDEDGDRDSKGKHAEETE